MNPQDMTDDELLKADACMMAEYRSSNAKSLTDEHRATKAELGRRSAERLRKESRSRAGKKAAVTRVRRAAAGLPPMRRAFTLDNAPAGGWTDADRV